jgi:transcriptional regulator with XRE-family HTH domain
VQATSTSIPSASPTLAGAASFGSLLRQWRTLRNYSQLGLALAADVSSRHVRFMETGRARPSPEMVSLMECGIHRAAVQAPRGECVVRDSRLASILAPRDVTGQGSLRYRLTSDSVARHSP